MEEKRKFWIILRIVLIVIFIYYIASLFGIVKTAVVREYIDFPCEAEVSSQGCLIVTGTHGEASKGINLEVFITYQIAGVRGASCEHLISTKKSLNFLRYRLEADGNTLIIDKKIKLPKDNSWERTRTKLGLNPWRIKKEYINLKNHGIVTCKTDMSTGLTSAYGPTLIVIGNAGTHYKANKYGIIILLLLIGIFALSFLFTRKKNKEKA